MERSRKTLLLVETPQVDPPPTAGRGKPKKGKAIPKAKEKVYLENSSNVLMDFRKAASHPMLFRRLFTDDMLGGITKQLMKEPEFKKRGAIAELVKEDMTVMTDAELQLYCSTFKVCCDIRGSWHCADSTNLVHEEIPT